VRRIGETPMPLSLLFSVPPFPPSLREVAP